jgi:hypothetical protein
VKQQLGSSLESALSSGHWSSEGAGKAAEIERSARARRLASLAVRVQPGKRMGSVGPTGTLSCTVSAN